MMWKASEQRAVRSRKVYTSLSPTHPRSSVADPLSTTQKHPELFANKEEIYHAKKVIVPVAKHCSVGLSVLD